VKIRKYGRYFAVFDAQDVLVCLCVYRKGACEVVRRLEKSDAVSKNVLGTNPAVPYLQANEDLGTVKGVAQRGRF
jgi:hypothetical protein